MAPVIINVHKEHLPSLRFIGKRHTNADRICDFGHKRNGPFQRYEKNRACFFKRYNSPRIP
jgi:hypothetical protein